MNSVIRSCTYPVQDLVVEPHDVGQPEGAVETQPDGGSGDGGPRGGAKGPESGVGAEHDNWSTLAHGQELRAAKNTDLILAAGAGVQ